MTSPSSLVWDAWLKVKDNGGAAGADGVTIEQFEEDLKGNLYPAVESDVVGVVLPRTGPGGGDPKSGWDQGARHPECR